MIPDQFLEALMIWTAGSDFLTELLITFEGRKIIFIISKKIR